MPGRGPTKAIRCAARDVLDRVGDKWSVYVIFLLGDATRRFTELRRSIDGISQRMLTVTLRNLERDGIVNRTVYPVVPPHVDYALTPLGRTLRDIIDPLMAWADEHTTDIDRARATYDRRALKKHRGSARYEVPSAARGIAATTN
ncbi:MAG: winged helix-turn-helix transcriptional regulator [Armatimonadota bacterium]